MNGILQALNSICPTWPSVAEETAKVPYMLYSEEDTPIITFDGIAGYDSTLSVTVVESTKIKAQALRDKVVGSLHGTSFDDATLYYQGAHYVDYPEEHLASYELNFKLLR